MKGILTLAAISGFLAVTIGAFGAHGLKDLLGENLPIYETGNRYHFYHTFAIYVSTFLYFFYPTKKGFLLAAYLFGTGILFFSGSLYALSISGIRILGAITPIGGILFLAGWGVLGYTSSQKE